MTLVAREKESGRPIGYGVTVTDFRGDPAEFVRATRANDDSRDGKVTVRKDGVPREYYARVFGLTVAEE